MRFGHTELLVLWLLLAFANADSVFINAGGDPIDKWRCDTGAFASKPSYTFIAPPATPVTVSEALKPVFTSHRWAPSGDLVYTFPMAIGTRVMVTLFFMEIYKNAKPGKRMFTIMVNGEKLRNPINSVPLDIYQRTGSIGKPLVINAGMFEAKDGKIEIRLARIPGMNNPMISGISLAGTNADALIGDVGLGTCVSTFMDNETKPTPAAASSEAEPAQVPSTPPATTSTTAPSVSAQPISPLPETAAPLPPSPAAPSNAPPPKATMPPPMPAPPSPKPDPCKSSTRETNFMNDHFAHAVSGGPYIETDFKKQGYALVNLDGLRSHSHFTQGNQNGEINSYRWSWIDASNPGADSTGKVIITSGTAKQNFPIGETALKLEVADQFCNTAMETTTVTINKAAMPGAYCYYYDFGSAAPTTVTLPQSLNAAPKPKYAMNVGDINFGSTASFGTFPFSANTFAIRCVFSIEVPVASNIVYKVVHTGPIKVYNDGKLVASSDSTMTKKMTPTPPKQFAAGIHQWQILYMRPKSVAGTLQFLFNSGAVIPAETVRHDAGAKLPVITGLSKNSALVDEIITITGSAFVNGVMVKFGTVVAETIEASASKIMLRVPPGSNSVDVTISTDAGVSNGMKFTYIEKSPVGECQVVKFTETTVKNSAGGTLNIPDIAALTYGPDGRLYCGSQKSEVLALSIDVDLKVSKTCTKNIAGTGPRRWVLGVAFNPKSIALKLFFTSNTFFWANNNLLPFEQGWINGKVQSITLSSPTACFNNDLADVVTGLPVSNHDHGNNFLHFLPSGKMVIGVGGFSNGGIVEPTDGLGGIPVNPLSGAIVQCPASGTAITYSNLAEPFNTTVSGGCTIYAPGFRNTFGSTFHTNGKLYATDNGPNQGFGKFSTNCAGASAPGQTKPDKLFLVQKGKCHGHPNLVRSRSDPAQCVREDPGCVKPLISNLQPSTNGVVEYRANMFKGKLKGNLFLSKFGGGSAKKGRVTRVILSAGGTIASNGVTNIFHPDSGLGIVQGPRGELIMSRVFKSSFLVLTPVCENPTFTSFIAVHPSRGPAGGGQRVTITGFNFGQTPSATFGGTKCTAVTIINDDAFSCVTPSGKGQVKVVVTGTTGANLETSGTDFWYW